MENLVSKVLGLLTDAALKKYNEYSHLKADLVFLKGELVGIMDRVKNFEQIECLEEGKQQWIFGCKEVCYAIEDCIGEYSSKTRIDKEVMLKFGMIERVKELKASLIMLNQRYATNRWYDYVPVTSDDSCTIMTSRKLLNRLHNTGLLLGCEDHIKRLARLLSKEETESFVVSITGCEGIGKTSVALLAFKLSKQFFDVTAAVEVSVRQGRETNKVLTDILKQIEQSDTSCYDSSDDELIERIYKILSRKRYLIFLDDLRALGTWKVISPCFPEHRGKVIVTTRLQSVANMICSCKGSSVIKISPLGEADARTLFLSTLEMLTPCPQFEGMLQKILQRCNGVPLAILCAANHLGHQASLLASWKELSSAIDWQWDTSAQLGILNKILLTSYYRLPSHLKPLALYLSGMASDCICNADEVIQCWLAEDLINPKAGVEKYLTGQACIRELVDNNFIEPFEFKSNGMVKSLRIPGLMHDVLYEVACKESFFTKLPLKLGQDCTSRIHRLSLVSAEFDYCADKDVCLKSARSFMMVASRFPAHIEKFTYLRVLLVKECEKFTNADLKSVSKLRYLKVLIVKSAPVTELPCVFGKNLEYLSMLGTQVRSIINLRLGDFTLLTCLRMGVVALPRGIGSMENLEILETANIFGSQLEAIEELGDLAKLEVLSFYWQAEGFFHEYTWALKCSLEKLLLGKLRVLKGSGQDNCNDSYLNFMSYLRVHSCLLEELSISADQYLCILPVWTSHMQSLVDLSISVVEARQNEMVVLGNLPLLARLKLSAKFASTASLYFIADSFRALTYFAVSAGELDLIFMPGCMSSLENLTMISMNLTYHGMSNLGSLRNMEVVIYNAGFSEACSAHVALQDAAVSHPNRPIANVKTPWRRPA